MSATPDSTLANPEQRIADLERQLAECRAERDQAMSERDEALQRETATAEVLQIINSSPGALVPVFDAMLEKATRLCEADFGILLTYEEGGYRAAALRNVPPAYADALRELIRPGPKTALARVARGDPVAQIVDISADEELLSEPMVRGALEIAGFRTVLAVPLRQEGKLLGAFTIYRQQVRPFSDKQIALLQNFAAQAVIAMENARLITETREALEQQTATAEVLGVINSSPGNLSPVFDAMLEKALRLCGAAHGDLTLAEGDNFRAVAMRGLPEAFAEVLRQPLPRRDLHDQLLSGFVQIPDVTAVDFPDSPVYRAAIGPGGVRTLLAVPLRKDGVLLGYITANRREVRPFTDKQIALLQSFAAQAVIAMENARLLTETREALEQQTATAEMLQVINASPGDLAPVLRAILEKAHSLCGIAFGSLLIREGAEFCVVAAREEDNDPNGGSRYIRVRREQDRFRPPEGTPLWRVSEGARLVHLSDATADDSYHHAPAYARLIDAGGVRTLLLVPLRKDDELLGAITAFRREVRPFSEKEIALLQNFAQQAVIAMENARLITETREALEQQTATAEVLGVINSSPGDLTPVFDAILEKAHSLCGATQGGLFTYDGEHFRAVVTHGAPEPFAEVLRHPFGAPTGSAQDRLLRGERLVHIPDITGLAGQLPEFSVARAAVQAGVKTLLMVALRSDHDMLGYIAAFRQEVRPFSEKQIALLENFAAQAVIAMESARLLTETREALEQQTATAEVLQVINSSPGDLAPVFDAILEKAHTLCGAAHGVMVIREGERLRTVAANGEPAFVEAVQQFGPIRPPDGSGAARLIRGEQIVHIADFQAESFLENAPPQLRRISELGRIRTVAMVPLRKDDAVIGFITAFRQEVRPFTDKQIALLQNFAAQAVIAMENARLITETREALEQQTATAEVLQVINSSPGDLAPVFDAMLEKALRLCGASFGILHTFDGERIDVAAYRGVSAAFADFLSSKTPNPVPAKGLFAEFSRGESFIHIDAATGEAYRAGVPVARAMVEIEGGRTLLAVPLRKDDAVLGAFVIYRREVHPFTDKQIALLQNFAQQAVIAMENARLLTETREALEQQTATAEVLQIINASPGDLTPVFDAILDKAHTLCGVTYGSLQLFDGEHFRAVSTRGIPEPLVDVIRKPSPPHPGGPGSRLIAGAAYFQIPDIAELVGQSPTPPDTIGLMRQDRLRIAVDLAGIRTMLFVPLRKDKTLLGAIVAGRKEVHPFSEKEIGLLQNFAAQAVIAMENARLLGELRQRTDEVAELNRGLEARVAEQVDELGRVGRLKRFLAPQLAELIVSQGDERILESHRRDIVVVFCDLRGYTAFTETAEPEEVLDFLREYHGALGPLVSQFEGTLDQFSGDGIMVFFNDPVPIPDPAERAVKMAVAMREAAGTLIADWRERGRELGFGAGIAQGYATLGQIGFSERSGYTAIGTVCNVAARLCAEATDGQILLSQRVNVALKGTVPTEQLGAVTLKGLTQPVVAYNVPLAATQPALRVIEGGPQTV